MKRIATLFFLLLTSAIIFLFFIFKKESMIITSPAFQHNGPIPSTYTCDGKDLAPPLTFSEIPVGTQSLALIVDDPDAPRGTWVHWLAWNLPATTTILPEGGALPEGVIEGTTDFGRTGYGGPCPPSGTHRYFFKLYALNVPGLSLPSSALKSDLERALQGHTLVTAELVGLYQRQ